MLKSNQKHYLTTFYGTYVFEVQNSAQWFVKLTAIQRYLRLDASVLLSVHFRKFSPGWIVTTNDGSMADWLHMARLECKGSERRAGVRGLINYLKLDTVL